MQFLDQRNSIGAVTAQLLDWASNVVPGLSVTIGPGSPAAELSASFTLVRVCPEQRLTSAKAALVIGLHYVCQIAASNTIEAQSALGELVFAAMQHPAYEVDVAPDGGCAIMIMTKLIRTRSVGRGHIVTVTLRSKMVSHDVG